MSLDVSRVEELFYAAQQIAHDDERRAWLETACAGDQGLRGRVEALLSAANEASQFLNRPAVELAGAAAVTQGFDGSSVSPNRLARPEKGEELSFLQPTARPDSLGRLGHYEVLEVIGQGGFGIVLRAFDEKLHRVVALKVLAPELAANGSARKRFIREARTAAAVKNEHVVSIYGVDENAQPPYLAMEMIDGKSLQDKIDQQGPLSLTEILRIGMQMAEGLAAAHKQGLVHRDIKPANILLENGVERVKITDFGLARAVDDASVTQSGTVAGTPMYMSPEQAEGLAIDHRSDLFSLGTVLYAMCTGHSAFRGSNTHAVLKRVIEASPRPIREVNPDAPEWLCAIISKLHAKNPADRIATAHEVAELLGQHLAHEQNPSQHHRPAAVAAATVPPSKDYGDLEPKSSLPAYKQSSSNVWPIVVIVVAIVALLIFVPLIFGVVTVAIHYFRNHERQAEQNAQGVLSLKLNDQRVEFRVDGTGANQTAVSDLQIPLPVGEHWLWLKLKDVELTTEKFTIHPGQMRELQVSIAPTHAFARYEGRHIGMQQLAGPPVAIEIGGGSIVLPWNPPATQAVLQLAPNGSEWIRLFNGRDLEGWEATSADDWRVENGIIHGTGSDSYLFSKAGEFEDFHLLVDYRINKDGDSGIRFRSPASYVRPPGRQAFRFVGFEAELSVREQAPYRDGGLTYKDEIHQILAESSIPPHQPYDWTQVEIIAQQERIQIIVNGRVVTDYIDKERKFRTGRIGLTSFQSSGFKTEVEYRRVDIRRLPSGPQRAIAPFTAEQATALQKEWSAHLGVPVEIPNSVNMKLRLIPPGEYLLGTPETPLRQLVERVQGADAEKTMRGLKEEIGQRRIVISEPFYLGTCEVTVGQFRRFVEATRYVTDGERSGNGGWSHRDAQWKRHQEHVWKTPGPWKQTDDLPVVHVSHRDATAFVQWLSNEEGRQYALPTRAQWEFAARAGTTGLFGASDEPSTFVPLGWGNYNLPADRPSQPQPVGTKEANPFGLFDMQGNVWEWTNTWRPTNQILCGGGWYCDDDRTRPAAVATADPAIAWDAGTGFRVALVGNLKVQASEKPAEFVSLFNGNDLTGWKTHPDEPGDWKVEEGAIVGAKPSHLYSERGNYTDFHLRCEVQINAGGEGGIFFRSPFARPGPTGMMAYEVQVYAGKPSFLGFGTGAISTTTTRLGWHVLEEAMTNFPTDTWVPLDVIVRGNTVESFVAGKPVAKFIDPDRLYAEGHIVLQTGEKTRVKYRKLEVKELRTVTPESPEVEALRAAVAAVEKSRETVRRQVEAEVVSPLALIRADCDWIEARIKLAQAKAFHAEVVLLFREELIVKLTEERELVAERVKAGVEAASALDAVDVRLADARVRFVRALTAMPQGTRRPVTKSNAPPTAPKLHAAP